MGYPGGSFLFIVCTLLGGCSLTRPNGGLSAGDAGVPADLSHLASDSGTAIDASGPCVPLSATAACERANASCGAASDGCGGGVSCGTCNAPDTCGGGGVPGQCGAPPELMQSWSDETVFSATLTALSWKRDGSRIAVVGGRTATAPSDAWAVTLDATTGVTASPLDVGFPSPTDVAYGPDGSSIGVTFDVSGGVRGFSVDASGNLAALTSYGCPNLGYGGGIAWTPDGTALFAVGGISDVNDASACYSNPTAAIYLDSEIYWVGGAAVDSSGTRGVLTAMALNGDPSGSTHIDEIVAIDLPGLTTPQTITALGDTEAQVGRIAFLPGSTTVVFGAGSYLMSTDVASNAPPLVWRSLSAQVTALAVHPKQPLVAVSTADGTIGLYNTNTHDVELSVTHPGVQAVAWSPDGTSLASGGTSPQVALWQLVLP